MALTAKHFNKLDSFQFLSDPKKFIYKNIPEVFPGNASEISIQKENFASLLAKTSRSKVGVGEKTVLDLNSRSSHEITELDISSKFIETIKPIVEDMAMKIDNPTKIQIHPYKLVLYQKGDFFESHIDNSHRDHMIMTLIVDFPTELEGGTLIIDDQAIPHTKDQLKLILFYNDIEHRVTKVTQGSKMSLIFDVCQESELIPEVIDKYYPSIRSTLGWNDIKNVAFITNHVYFSHELKGPDRICYEIFKRLGKTSIKEVLIKDQRVFYPEIFPILRLGGVDKLYTPSDNLEIEKLYFFETDEDEDYIDDSSVPVDPKYCLGDVYFISSDAGAKVKFEAFDVTLGNEGFFGKIYESLAVFLEK